MTTPLRATPRRYPCLGEKCHTEATVIPKLWVPAHPMSINAKAEAVSALMGVTLCDACFANLDPQRFLDESQGGAQIKEGIGLAMRKRNAIPDFAKAALSRVTPYDHDWERYGKAKEKARAI